MRVYIRIFLMLLSLSAIFVILSFWTKCSDLKYSMHKLNPKFGMFEDQAYSSQVSYSVKKI